MSKQVHQSTTGLALFAANRQVSFVMESPSGLVRADLDPGEARKWARTVTELADQVERQSGESA